MLIREMKDLVIRQEKAWQESLERREAFVEEQRKLAIQRAVEKRKALSPSDPHKEEVRLAQQERRKTRNKAAKRKTASSPLLPALSPTSPKSPLDIPKLSLPITK
jgi:hypothetical protein